MKLTITDKVFVPVTNEITVFKLHDGNDFKDSVKEETNKYVLSREELENLISNVVELSREGIVVHRISEWETEKEFDYNDSQIISLVL
jgi:hypothetical protein